MTLRPCLDCGTPVDTPRCSECAPPVERERHNRKSSPRARGYDTAWDRLSKRARALQPFCEVCGATTDLQLDHSEEAWTRKALGRAIRLQDVTVVCGYHNRERGRQRPNQDPGGTPPGESDRDPRREAKFASHTPRGTSEGVG